MSQRGGDAGTRGAVARNLHGQEVPPEVPHPSGLSEGVVSEGVVDETGAARSSLVRHLASAGLVVTWSAGFIGAELGHRAGAGPFTILSWRFVLLSILLVVACAGSGTSLRDRRAWRRQVGLGLLNQVIYLGFVFWGISEGIHGGTAALIAALQPLLVMTVAGRLLGEATSLRAWVGTGIGFVGVAVVVSGDIATGHAEPWAYLLPTIAMLALTAGTVASRRIRPPETLLQTITMQAVVSAVGFVIVAAVVGQLVVPPNLASWTAIGWLILLPSIGGYGLYVYVTRESGATVVSTLLYLSPPTTMLWAFTMFGDPLTPTALAGLALSATGVILVLTTRVLPRPESGR